MLEEELMTTRFRERLPLGAAAAFLALLFFASPLRAQTAPRTPDAGIIQQLGSPVSMDLAFGDERGGSITLGQASAGKPFILALVYYRCPMLCNLILGGLLETLVNLGPSAGERFNVVTVSFDPSEGPDLASAKKAHYLRAYGRPGGEAGWRFLSDSGGSAQRLCREAGFRISYDPITRQYAHASGILVLTPEGRISKYFMGVSYPVRDVRLALVEASGGRIGRLSDELLLLCLRYDPERGKYTLAVWNILRMAAVLTVLGLLLLLACLSRRKARSQAAPLQASGAPPGRGGG